MRACVRTSETWLLRSREERGLKVFENRLQDGMFELKREQVTGAGQSCVTGSFMARTVGRWRRNVARMREKHVQGFGWEIVGIAWNVMAAKYVTDMGCQSVEWICLAQGRDKWRAVVSSAADF